MTQASAGVHGIGPGVFRLFLAVLVVFQHAGLLALGHFAVLVFFVLSGYWVTAMWEKSYLECRRPYLTFMVSRYWRLLPVYYLCYGLALLLQWFRAPFWPLVAAHFQEPDWIARVLILISSSYQPSALHPTWSLDVEMQFYFALPLLGAVVDWCARQSGVFRGVALGLVLAVASAAFFFLLVGKYTVFFLAGMLIWKFRWHAPARLAWGSALAVGGTVVILWLLPGAHDLVSAPATIQGNHRLHFANELLCSALALAAVPFVSANVRTLGSNPLDRHLGNLAYAVYLFHYIPKQAIDLMVVHRGWPTPLVLALNFGLVALGSLAIYGLIDRPIDELRRRWVKSRRRPQPAGVAANPTEAEIHRA